MVFIEPCLYLKLMFEEILNSLSSFDNKLITHSYSTTIGNQMETDNLTLQRQMAITNNKGPNYSNDITTAPKKEDSVQTPDSAAVSHDSLQHFYTYH